MNKDWMMYRVVCIWLNNDEYINIDDNDYIEEVVDQVLAEKLYGGFNGLYE